MNDFRSYAIGGALDLDAKHQREADRLREIIAAGVCKICVAPFTPKASERAYNTKMAVVPGTLISLVIQCQECGHLVEYEETL